MVIIISNPVAIKNEHVIINQLFDEGLEFYHLRKPGCSVNEMTDLLDRINSMHYSKISLHQHHELADSYEIKRLHYTEEKRKYLNDRMNEENIKGKIISSSIHNPEESKFLSSSFDYVFLGPVFNSISKSGYNSILNNDFKLPELRNMKMIALGGINNSKIRQVKEYGFDGVGVLGHIWKETNNAVANFKSIKREWER